MKILTGTKEALESSDVSQFRFGARLVAFPRIDRWQESEQRLQSIQGGTGDLTTAHTYDWQVIKYLPNGEPYIAHIEESGFNPLSMLELYGAEYLDEQYGEGFSDEYGHLSSTEYVTQEIIDTDENISTITV